MNSNVEKIIQKLKDDLDFQKKIVAAGNREEIVEAAKTEGIELSMEDIDVVNEMLQKETLGNIDQTQPVGKFLAKMLGDKDFAEQVMIQTEPEAVLDLAKGQGISLTLQDLEEVNQTLIALEGGRNTVTAKTGELSEEDLEQVAGGFALTSITEMVTSTVLTVTSLVSTISALSVMSVVGTLISITHLQKQ